MKIVNAVHPCQHLAPAYLALSAPACLRSLSALQKVQHTSLFGRSTLLLQRRQTIGISRARLSTVQMSVENGFKGLPFRDGEAGSSTVKARTRFEALFVTPSVAEAKNATSIELVPTADWEQWRDKQSKPVQAWLLSRGKKTAPSKNTVLLVPNFEGEQAGTVRVVVFGLEENPGTIWAVAGIYGSLSPGVCYKFENIPTGIEASHIEIGWALGAYSFKAYKSKSAKSDDDALGASLVRLSKEREIVEVDAAIAACYMVRDLISIPTEEMGPANLAAAASALADSFSGAKCTVTVGDDLLRSASYYPQVHRVGRAAAADRAPRLIDLHWNDGASKSVVLVGKGVCYDTGGLSMKPTSGMLTMKKDMGGAAHVLGLASMIMAAQLDVSVRVLIPAVENCVSANSYRPGDVIVSRNNITTEITNTDAEGRLVLADALVAACESKPSLIIDFATLTGAQRVALGADIPSFWIDDDEIASTLSRMSAEVDDLVWRLPLHKPYRRKLDSAIADIKNCASGGYGGAITAALYLKEFVDDSCPWMHVDLMAFNPTARAGRPEGGEAMGLRAVYALVKSMFSSIEQ